MNLFTFPKSTIDGFIFHADQVIFDGKELKTGVADVLAYLHQNDVHMSIYSAMNTEELTDNLEKAGVCDCFELVMGNDILDNEEPYTDATRKSEECFQLDHVHKYVVVCTGEEVVEAAVQEGLRTIVITDGKDIDAKFEEKCWRVAETIDGLYTQYKKENKMI